MSKVSYNTVLGKSFKQQVRPLDRVFCVVGTRKSPQLLILYAKTVYTGVHPRLQGNRTPASSETTLGYWSPVSLRWTVFGIMTVWPVCILLTVFS